MRPRKVGWWFRTKRPQIVRDVFPPSLQSHLITLALPPHRVRRFVSCMMVWCVESLLDLTDPACNMEQNNSNTINGEATRRLLSEQYLHSLLLSSRYCLAISLAISSATAKVFQDARDICVASPYCHVLVQQQRRSCRGLSRDKSFIISKVHQHLSASVSFSFCH